MAVKEKKAVQLVTVCDMCGSDINSSDITHINASSEGYAKREHFELDLCIDCATNVGLKRRGRRPAQEQNGDEANGNGNKPRRGRRPKAEQPKAIALGAKDDDWEEN